MGRSLAIVLPLSHTHTQFQFSFCLACCCCCGFILSTGAGAVKGKTAGNNKIEDDADVEAVAKVHCCFCCCSSVYNIPLFCRVVLSSLVAFVRLTEQSVASCVA